MTCEMTVERVLPAHNDSEERIHDEMIAQSYAKQNSSEHKFVAFSCDTFSTGFIQIYAPNWWFDSLYDFGSLK